MTRIENVAREERHPSLLLQDVPKSMVPSPILRNYGTGTLKVFIFHDEKKKLLNFV